MYMKKIIGLLIIHKLGLCRPFHILHDNEWDDELCPVAQRAYDLFKFTKREQLRLTNLTNN